MSYEWIEAVYDRSAEDVARVKALMEKTFSGMTTDEKTEWLAGLKGALNTSDLERIENNIQYLSDELDLGLTTYVGNIPAQPTESYFANMVENTRIIRLYYAVHSYTPSVPAQPLNDYEKWNAIEQILNDAYEGWSQRFYYYAGSEVFAGESTGLLL